MNDHLESTQRTREEGRLFPGVGSPAEASHDVGCLRDKSISNRMIIVMAHLISETYY